MIDGPNNNVRCSAAAALLPTLKALLLILGRIQSTNTLLDLQHSTVIESTRVS